MPVQSLKLRKRCAVIDSTDRRFCEATTGPHPHSQEKRGHSHHNYRISVHALAGILFLQLSAKLGFPSGSAVICLQCRRCRKLRFDPWVRKITWRRAWQTHSSILAGRIPRTEEPGRLQSLGSQRVGHDWSNWAHTHCLYYKILNWGQVGENKFRFLNFNLCNNLHCGKRKKRAKSG